MRDPSGTRVPEFDDLYFPDNRRRPQRAFDNRSESQRQAPERVRPIYRADADGQSPIYRMFLGIRSEISDAVHGLRPLGKDSAPPRLCRARTGVTTLQASLDVADWSVARPRFAPGLSTTYGGFATGDLGVSPDRTHTGWLHSACRLVTSSRPPCCHGAQSPGRAPCTPGQGHACAPIPDLTSWTMASSSRPTEEDYDDAARLGLLGLMADRDSDSIMEKLAALHPRNNTFPAEVLLELAAEAIAESGASPGEPIQYEGMRDRYLPEYHFRGKSQQHKSHYALMAAAMIRAGVYPDLLDEAYGWGIEDMWEYAFFSLVLYGRVAAQRTGQTPGAVAAVIAKRRGIDLDSAKDR